MLSLSYKFAAKMEQNPFFLNESFHKQVDNVQAYVRQIYHVFHTRPELSYHEEKTAARICQELQEMGVPFRDHVGGFGILAHLSFGNPKAHCFALRADMDALPIQEKNGVPYASQIPGVMHACGHDSHMASMLGINYYYLSQNNYYYLLNFV